MKRKILLLMLAIVFMAGTALGTEYLLPAGAEEITDYTTLFDKTSDDITLTQLSEDDNTEWMTIPAGSIKMAASTSTEGVANVIYTKKAEVDLSKTVYIKWRENFESNMAGYHLGLSTLQCSANFDPTSSFLNFYNNWGDGTTSNGGLVGTMSTTATTLNQQEIGKWDTSKVSLARQKWYFFQIKIEYNDENSQYDLTFSSEGHDGSNKQTQEVLHLDSAKKGKMYFYFYGFSHQGGAESSIYLLNDTRSSLLEGTNFKDWASLTGEEVPVDPDATEVKVTTEEQLKSALENDKVTKIDAVHSASLTKITGDFEITRSLVLNIVNESNTPLGGESGIAIDGTVTVKGANKDVTFAMNGGTITSVVADGAVANLMIVGLGYGTAPEHCAVVKNGGEIKLSWGVLKQSTKAIVKVESGKFTLEGNAGSAAMESNCYTSAYEGLPDKYLNSDGAALVYAETSEGGVFEITGESKLELEEYTKDNIKYYIKLPTSAKVTTEEAFRAALENPQINEIIAVVGDELKFISGDIEINRTLRLYSMTSDGQRGNGNAGIVFEDTLTVTGENTKFTMEGGIATIVVDGAEADLHVVGMGYNKTKTEEGYRDHSLVVKNGGKVTSHYGSLDESRKGAVRLENGSSYEETDRQDIYQTTAYVSATASYPGVFPQYFYNKYNGTMKLYAVMTGENNKLGGVFENISLHTFTAQDGTSYVIEYVPVSDFEFEKSEVTVSVDGSEEVRLMSTIPEEPTNFLFSFTSANEEIATVEEVNSGLGFKVTGKKAGTTQITITAIDVPEDAEHVTKTISVTVVEPYEVGFEIDTSAMNLEISAGEDPDLSKLAVSAIMSNGKLVTLSNDKYSVDLGSFDKNTAGEYTITVTYGSYEAKTFTIKVKEAPAASSDCGSCSGSAAGCGAALLALAAGVAFLKKKR